MRTKRVGEKEEPKMAKPAITDPAMQVVLVPNLKYVLLFVQVSMAFPKNCQHLF